MAESSRTPAELNERQKKFADYVIKLGRSRAKEAAEIAGYSKKTAGVQANQLLKNLKVKAYIKERIKTAAEPKERAEADRKLVADGDEVLQFLTATMRGEVKDQFGLDAQLKDSKSSFYRHLHALLVSVFRLRIVLVVLFRRYAFT